MSYDVAEDCGNLRVLAIDLPQTLTDFRLADVTETAAFTAWFLWHKSVSDGFNQVGYWIPPQSMATFKAGWYWPFSHAWGEV